MYTEHDALVITRNKELKMEEQSSTKKQNMAAKLEAVVASILYGDKVTVTFATCAGVLQIEALSVLQREKLVETVSPLGASSALGGWSNPQNRRYIFYAGMKFSHRRFWELYSPEHFESIEITH